MGLPTISAPIIGVFLEPVKAMLLRISDLRFAKDKIYRELAQYFADIEEAASGDAAYHFGQKAREKPPIFPVLDYYQSHKFDLLLRIDKKGGIQALQRSLMKEYERISQKRLNSSLAGKAHDLLEKHQNDLDIELLQKYKADINKNRSKSSMVAA